MKRIKKLLTHAFLVRDLWIIHYEEPCSPASSKLTAIHDAKTKSVLVKCRELQEDCSFSAWEIYAAIITLFSGDAKLRLSNIADTSTIEKFANAIQLVVTRSSGLGNDQGKLISRTRKVARPLRYLISDAAVPKGYYA